MALSRAVLAVSKFFKVTNLIIPITSVKNISPKDGTVIKKDEHIKTRIHEKCQHKIQYNVYLVIFYCIS